MRWNIFVHWRGENCQGGLAAKIGTADGPDRQTVQRLAQEQVVGERGNVEVWLDRNPQEKPR